MRAELVGEDKQPTICLALVKGSHAYQGAQQGHKVQGYGARIVSPPGVTAELPKSRVGALAPGFAMDIFKTEQTKGKPYNFDKRSERQLASRKLRRRRPYLLVGTPECKHFSSLQAYNTSPSKRLLEKATTHVNFCCSLYREQYDDGVYFLH